MEDKKALERLKQTGRNDPCPCGTEKKYKKCHMVADQKVKSDELESIGKLAEQAHENESKKDDGDKKEIKKPSGIPDMRGTAFNGGGQSKSKLLRRKKV